MKDNFSIQSTVYARSRPSYPPALIEALAVLTPNRQQAWDCGTGNGQVATLLAPHFERVWASDISENQLKNARIKPNITYVVESAEHSALPAHSTDLVVVAQAIHWFNFERFYAEVRRVLRPNGIIAAIGYSLMTLHHTELDQLIRHFYSHTVHHYWDTERQYIDEVYQTIPFPFKEITLPSFQIQDSWTAEQLIDYLHSWSATQHYIRQHQQNPVDLIEADIKRIFDQQAQIALHFDIIQRIGQV